MISVLHVLDRACDETTLQVLGVLESHSAEAGVHHAVCSIDGAAARRAGRFCGERVFRAERRLDVLNWAPRLAPLARQVHAGLLHAWGVEAAAACSTGLPDLPLILTLLNPEDARTAPKWLRAFPTDATVVTASQAARSLLLAAGSAPERAVVIRGPVDFAAINRARQADLRRSIVGDASPVLLMAGPASRGGGQYYGIWAAAIVSQIHRGLCVVMPYESEESRCLRRFADGLGMASLLRVPDSRLTWPELAASADVLLAPAVDETCAEPIATAMAAGVVVVASAVRSVTELISDHRTGLLCKPRQPRRLAARILAAVEDHDLRRKLTDAARAQAFETFSIRAFLDNYARLYDNVLRGRFPAESVRDPLVIA